MSQFFQIHPETPQPRLVKQAADILKQGGLAVIPTDCAYALACHIQDKQALERVKRIRKLDDKHNFTLMCRDLTEISTYAKVDNTAYRLLKNHTPGAFTFILDGTREVPRRLMHPKRKQIGIRVPDNAIACAIMEELGEPLMTTSLIMPGDTMPLSDPYDIRQMLEHAVDLVVDGGYCGFEATTVVDMTGDEYSITRQGVGQLPELEV
ncbi:threonylcarbamoyl-AMP synthase [Bermanella marisrubri]|uniref:Putative translation factor (SUA5) n=1 Tax=Bermanella marisrubri TaxID=207949 RepID=Q1N5L7_9GAMM|nr:L-threonylcarbamoyladenylate synthase [Bermanella marisrubri]EAT13925.1 putative translation factor (SUA5) [Oceanobacter sp. RED65] [Bermanella marisrubri]QIZ84678.1 threonylcarbamoyl-AMP synthase [Bermanella marisrubri]